MKIFEKIVWSHCLGVMLMGCLGGNLYAQPVKGYYYIEIVRQSLDIGTSGWICGNDYHALEFEVKDKGGSVCIPTIGKSFYGDYGTSRDDFQQIVAYGIYSTPNTIKLTGRAGDERNFNDEDSFVWAYEKGAGKHSLKVNPSQKHRNCTRSLDACYNVTVDDPVSIHIVESKSNNRYATETDNLKLKIDPFYKNNNPAVLQVTTDVKDPSSWIGIGNVQPGETVILSYNDIVTKAKKDFNEWLGKDLYFRVLKTLMDKNGTQTYGEPSKGIIFYPDGINFSITNTNRSFCEDGVILTVYLHRPVDTKYMELDTAQFRWVMVSANPEKSDNMGKILSFNCTMEPAEGETDAFIIKPNMSQYSSSHTSPFDEKETDWWLQLQDQNDKDAFATKHSFTIPAKPKEITIKQHVRQYQVGGTMYHVPNLSSHFAVLDITDPSYASHHRLPYTILTTTGDLIADIPELGVSTFEELSQAEIDTLKKQFNAECTDILKGGDAHKIFLKSQQGEIQLGENIKVTRIAMPEDGSFFVYTTNGKLYKATFTSGKEFKTEQLVPSDRVADFEITPDGTYCIYQKIDIDGLFYISLSSTFDTGIQLSSKEIDKMLPGNHFYRNATSHNRWMYVYSYRGDIYRIEVPNGNPNIIMSQPALANESLLSVTDNGIIYYEYPITNYNSDYQIYKKIIDGTSSVVYSDSDVKPGYYVYDRGATSTVCAPSYSGCPTNNAGLPEATPTSVNPYIYCSAPYCSSSTYCGGSCYKMKQEYSKNYIGPSRYNSDIHLLDVSTKGTMIVSKSRAGTTQYFKISDGKESVFASGSLTNFKTNPITQEVVFSNNNNTYKNSVSEANILVPNKIATNICFSGNGKYFLFIEKGSGRVYKQYMSDADANDDTYASFRENQWNDFVNKKLGTKVSSESIPLDQPVTWVLQDIDECTYTISSNPIIVTAPPKPIMTHTIVQKPTSPCAQDGRATIIYKGGGWSPYIYGNSSLLKKDDAVTVTNLHYGVNKIAFTGTNSWLDPTYIYELTIDGTTTMTVTAKDQTCATPNNGSVKITLSNISGNEITYRLVNTAYPSAPYTDKTTSLNYEFTGLSYGNYVVSARYGNCSYESSVRLNSKVFTIKDITKSSATTLEGTGSATVTFAELNGGTAAWKLNPVFTSPITQSVVTAEKIDPGTYNLSVVSSTGCTIDTSLAIYKPTCSGALDINYTEEGCHIYTEYLSGNSLFEGYTVKIVSFEGKEIVNSRAPNVVINQPGRYEMYLYNGKTKDSLLVHTFSFPMDTIVASASVVPPTCPGAEGAVTINVARGSLNVADSVSISTGEFSYGKERNYNLQAGVHTLSLLDKITETVRDQELLITTTLKQPLRINIPAAVPVSAWVNRTPPSCAGLADGQISLSNFRGGSGKYSYKVDNGNWQDTTVVVDHLASGTYIVYVKDALYGCVGDSSTVKFPDPDPVKLNFTQVQHPTCELENGMLSAHFTGGTEYYRYEFYRNNELLHTADYDTSSRMVIGDKLQDGFYKLQIYDGNNCSVSDIVTLRQYHNPQVAQVRVAAVGCYGANGGAIEWLSASGTSPVDSVFLHRAGLLYQSKGYDETHVFDALYAGDYTLRVKDILGCSANSPYPVTVAEPKPLGVTVDTIVSAVAKGGVGKVVFKVTGGNEGDKIIVLKQAGVTLLDDRPRSGSNGLLYFEQPAGTYVIAVTDTKGCTFTTDLLHIEEPAERLTFVVKEVKDALCKSAVGSIAVEGVGGWGGYRYKRGSDSNFTSLNTFDGLVSGNYVITVFDKLGATYTETVTVYEPQDTLWAEVVARVLPTCDNNGALSIHVTGGTPPYRLYADAVDTLRYAVPQVIQQTGIGSGNYDFHVLDKNNCRFELEAHLSAEALLTIENMEVEAPGFASPTSGMVQAIVRGGQRPYTYTWKKNLTEELPERGPVLTNIAAGYYGVEVTDAGNCVVQEQVYVQGAAELSFTVEEVEHETSFGAANGYVVLHAEVSLSDYKLITPLQTAVTYSSADVTPAFYTRNDTIYLHGLSGGKWLILGNNAAGQTVSLEILINPYKEYMIDKITINNVHRPGAQDGVVRIDVAGGGGDNRFTWTSLAGTSLSSLDNENSSILSGVPAGLYTMKVEDRYGNILQQQVEVKEPAEALKLHINFQNQTCKTYQDAYAVLSASGGGENYQFRHQSEQYFNNGTTFSNLELGLHYFYVIDSYGVIDSAQVQITEPEYLHAVVKSISPVTCKDATDGSAIFNITGGTNPYFFLEIESGIWRDGNVASGLSPGSHTFVFTDNNQCEGQDTLTVYIAEPEALSATSIEVTHTTCHEDNGKIAVGVQGGTLPYHYQWYNFNNTPIGNDTVVSGLQQNGQYRLVVTDKNGCQTDTVQRINASTKPEIVGLEIIPVLCYGDTTGTAIITAVLPASPFAPYTLRWSNGDVGTYSGHFPKGTHYVVVQDTNGCVTSRYFEITQPDSLYLRTKEIREPHCYGYSDGQIITETFGGVQAYTYLWSNGATTPHATSLAKGDYQVLLTDANGCKYEKTFVLDEPAYQTIYLGEDATICPGNTHLLDGRQYVSYRWFTDVGNISNERYLSVHEAGHYSLEAVDERGCSAWGEVNVAVGDHALKADFLLSSMAALGDTIIVFELSNMELDSLRWKYNYKAFEHITDTKDFSDSYILLLRSLQTGFYDIDLYAYAGGCYSLATKPIEIVTQENPIATQQMGYKEPLITSVKLYPNPNRSTFKVDVELRETSDIRLALYAVISGARVDDRTERGSDRYYLTYNLPQLSTGMYIMLVTAGSEHQQIKMIITK